MAPKTMVYEFTHGEQSWKLDIYKIKMSEWRDLESTTGAKGGVLLASLTTGLDFTAKHAFWWLARKRDEPDLDLDDDSLDIPALELAVRLVRERHDVPEGDAADPPESPSTTTSSTPT